MAVPVEFVHRHVDETHSPDEYNAEVLKRAAAMTSQTGTKIGAMHHLAESVRELAQQSSLIDPPAAPSAEYQRAKRERSVTQ